MQAILLVVIILLNTLVITITILDKALHTIPNIGITSLALADLLLAVTWFIIQLLVTTKGGEGEAKIKISKF